MILRTLFKAGRVFGKGKRLRQMLRHLGMVLEQVEEGIVVVDLLGTVRFVNSAWARMYGHKTSTGLVGKNLRDFYTPDQMEKQVKQFIDRTRQRGWFSGPMDLVRADRTTLAMRVKMVILKDEVDSSIGLMILAADISKQKRQQMTLDETSKQARAFMRKIEQLHQELANSSLAENELQAYCDQLEMRLEQQSAELAVLDQHIADDRGTDEPVVVDHSHSEEITAEGPHEFVPLDEGKLQAMAELARQLS
ncbi:MAG: PAS domain-containing protein [Planctomycetota bacterium]|jgi:PAS domain S-box-containing protein